MKKIEQWNDHHRNEPSGKTIIVQIQSTMKHIDIQNHRRMNESHDHPPFPPVSISHRTEHHCKNSRCNGYCFIVFANSTPANKGSALKTWAPQAEKPMTQNIAPAMGPLRLTPSILT